MLHFVVLKGPTTKSSNMASSSSAPGQRLQRTSAGNSSQGGSDVISATKRVVRKHPKKVATAVLWILGIFCMFFAPAPIKITVEMQERYQEKMDKVSVSSTSSQLPSPTFNLFTHSATCLYALCILSIGTCYIFFFSSDYGYVRGPFATK